MSGRFLRVLALVALFFLAVLAAGLANASPDAPILWLLPVGLAAAFGWVYLK